MNLFESIFLGVIQGATEFLPISSSGHLFLIEKYLGLEQNLNFEIALHFASLLAVLLFFHKEILNLAKNFLSLLIGKNSKTGEYALKILVATAITVPMALIVKENIFDAQYLTKNFVAAMLIITGIMVFIAEKCRLIPSQRIPTKDFISWPITIALGLVQGLTVIPGISRSGTTIAFLIILGMGRQFSVRTSFFLAIPTITGAMIFSLKDTGWTLPLGGVEIAGCVASFLVAIFAIKWMLVLIEKNWIWFAPYCLILGLGLILFR